VWLRVDAHRPESRFPHNAVAHAQFKIYGWVALIQALLYVQDQKLAHYLHLPPRATFRAQMAGCLVGSFITLGIINWQMNVVPDLCTPGQKDLLTCPYYVSRVDLCPTHQRPDGRPRSSRRRCCSV